MQAERHRPVGISVLAILATIAFVVDAFIALLFLAAIPVTLFGRTGFFGQALLGGILWGVLALIWAWVAYGLWNLNHQAWEFIVIITILNLIIAFIALLGGSSWESVAAGVIISAVILIYSLTPGVKHAFLPPGQAT